MIEQSMDILLVEPDGALAGLIEDHLARVFHHRVHRATTVEEALQEESTTRHDLIIASTDLDDGESSAFIERVRISNDCPIILMAECPTVEETVEALRLGVADYFVKPFALTDLTNTVTRLLEKSHVDKRDAVRQRRLRRTASKIIQERRDLRKRMELICQDIVYAYRDLAQKVSDSTADNEPVQS